MEKLRMVDCPTWDCTWNVELSCAYLVGCYGLNDFGEMEGAPAELIECCAEDPQGWCGPFSIRDDPAWPGETITADTGTICCGEGERDDPAPTECCYDHGEDNALENALESSDGPVGGWPTVLQDSPIFEEVVQDCGPWGHEPAELNDELVCAVVGQPTSGLLNELDCPTFRYASSTPYSDFVLEVDPADSYLTVHTSAGEDTVALSGHGAASTSPTGFVVGVVDAEPGSLGSTSYDDWRFWFDAPIDFNLSSGQFSVPVSQGYRIEGAGTEDGTWYNAVFEPTTNATGEFETTTWHLDYYSTFTGGWVSVHLEGSVLASSVP